MRNQQEIESTVDVLERRVLSHFSHPSGRVITALRWSLGDPSIPETAPLTLPNDDEDPNDEADCNGNCTCGGDDGHVPEPTAVQVLDMLVDSDPSEFTEGDAGGAIGRLAGWELDNILTRCRQLTELCEAAKKASA